jgi:hypothetical protein
LIYSIDYPDGRSEAVIEEYNLRFFFPSELTHLFARTGFRLLDVLFDFEERQGSQYPIDMVFIAQKE